jgi:hypothetical protein
MELILRALQELMTSLARGDLRIDIERVPLSQVAEVWNRDQHGRRPVFIP